jgi:hypothetical protein
MDLRTALRGIKLLVGCYLGISVLALVAIVWFRDDPALVTDTVWVRGTIVVATALLMLTFAAGTARGGRGAYLRLRIASAVMVVAIAVLVALPGFLPVWMRIEQTVCGVLLLGVVVLVNGKRLRSSFATRG